MRGGCEYSLLQMMVGWLCPLSARACVCACADSSAFQIGERTIASPQSLRRFYTAMALVKLDFTSILHPNCYSGAPFRIEVLQMVGVLVLLCALLASVHTAVVTRFSAASALLGRACVMLLLLLYPLVSQTAIELVACRSVTDLLDDGDVLQPAATSRLSLIVNPVYTCFEGYHLLPGVLAWVTIACFVAAFPIGSLVYLIMLTSRRASPTQLPSTSAINPLDASTKASTALTTASPGASAAKAAPLPAPASLFSDRVTRVWSSIVQSDFEARYFWMVHVRLAALLVLTVLIVEGDSPSIAMQAVVFVVTAAVLVVQLLLLLLLQPYTDDCVWKLPVDALMLVVSLVAALTNLLWYAALENGVGSVPPLEAAAEGLSYLVFALCVLLVVVFVIAFRRALVRGADVEQTAIATAAAVAAGVTATSASGSSPAIGPSSQSVLSVVKGATEPGGSSGSIFGSEGVVVCVNPLAASGGGKWTSPAAERVDDSRKDTPVPVHTPSAASYRYVCVHSTPISALRRLCAQVWRPLPLLCAVCSSRRRRSSIASFWSGANPLSSVQPRARVSTDKKEPKVAHQRLTARQASFLHNKV